MASQFYSLEVIDVTKPIKDAMTVSLRLPTELYDEFAYYPGQYLVVQFVLNGEEVRRSYSFNSSPFVEEELKFTVKRVKGGLVSNYINDYLNIGDKIKVQAPQGRFYANIQGDSYKTYFLFAAGSGITPIISILKSVLCESPSSTVYLLYGNSNQDTIIFKEELDYWQKEYPQQLKVVHTLSDPKVWTTWKQWTGDKGRIDGAKVEQFITDNPPVAQDTAYYICGPGAMNIEVKNTLLELGVPKELVHIEQFGGSESDSDETIQAVDNAAVAITLNGKKHALTVEGGKTILQTLKAAKIETPYSCESGVCGSCVAKVTNGKVEMKSCMALDDADIDNGLILTCQSLPTSKKVDITYDY